MSMLTSLCRAFDRLPDAPPFGFAEEKIGIVIGLEADGAIASVTPWLDMSSRKPQPRPMLVPQPVKRTLGIAANFLWDNTAYTFGLTAGEDKRTSAKHGAFIRLHEEALRDSGDEGLAAFLAFLHDDPRAAVAGHDSWSSNLLDLNVAFCLEAERLDSVFLHDRPAARTIWTDLMHKQSGAPQRCLATGECGPPARLHPSIKGVWGAKSSGAALVSFNLDAFNSYGHKQGQNAQISEKATFAYTTALNRYLAKDRGHCIHIGDTSMVFWADAENVELAQQAEVIFPGMIEDDDAAEKAAIADSSTAEIGIKLKQLRKGNPLVEIAPELNEGVRFFVLGLAPNAARLSVRYYFEDDFGVLAENYRRYCADMRIEPPPKGNVVSLKRYVIETAALGKKDNIPPKLVGDWTRAILTGTPYPLPLLSTVLMRIRADGQINAWRAAMLKAVLVRNRKMEVPVALDPEERNKGYVLGRLFAVYEHIQKGALGKNVNATIKDKYYGSASSTPRRVFATLNAGSVPHLAKIRKENKGLYIKRNQQIADIMALMDPSRDPFPTSLSAEQQALFGLGYYHQHSEFFKKNKADTDVEEEIKA